MVILQSIERLNKLDDDMPTVDTQIYGDNQPLITSSEKQSIPKLNGIQFAVINADTTKSTWTCNQCQNINSENTINCLKCTAKKTKYINNKQWKQKAVNV